MCYHSMFLELIPPSVNTAREQSGLQSVETRLFWNSLQSPGLLAYSIKANPSWRLIISLLTAPNGSIHSIESCILHCSWRRRRDEEATIPLVTSATAVIMDGRQDINHDKGKERMPLLNSCSLNGLETRQLIIVSVGRSSRL